jgi:hypothetical protein
MRSEQEIRERIKLWEEFIRNFKPHEGKLARDIRVKLGFPEDEDLVGDFYYDGDCAYRIVRELKWVLGEEAEAE